MEHSTDSTLAPPRRFRGASPRDGGPVARRADAPAARTPAPVEITAGLFRGRLTALILWNLFWGGKPFYQLFRAAGTTSHRGLVRELERLERYGLVEKGLGPLRGGRTEYRLTHPLGTSIRPLLAAFYEWGLCAAKAPRPRPDPEGRPRDPEERPHRAEAGAEPVPFARGNGRPARERAAAADSQGESAS